MLRASPRARTAVVEAVGARPRGHASSRIDTSSWTSAARGEGRAEVAGQKRSARSRAASPAGAGRRISSVVPPWDTARTTIALDDSSQVAVDGVRGVEVERRRPRRGERCGDLLGDDAALAHTGDNHAAARLTAAKYELDRSGERRSHGAFKPHRESEKTFSLRADEAGGCGGGIGWSGHDLNSAAMTMAGEKAFRQVPAVFIPSRNTCPARRDREVGSHNERREARCRDLQRD